MLRTLQISKKPDNYWRKTADELIEMVLFRRCVSIGFRDGLQHATTVTAVARQFGVRHGIFAKNAAIFFALGDGAATGRPEAFVAVSHD